MNFINLENFLHFFFSECSMMAGTYLMEIGEALPEVKANFNILHKEIESVIKMRENTGLSRQLLTYAKIDAKDGFRAAKRIERIVTEGLDYFL